jgi:hypothetical protein
MNKTEEAQIESIKELTKEMLLTLSSYSIECRIPATRCLKVVTTVLAVTVVRSFPKEIRLPLAADAAMDLIQMVLDPKLEEAVSDDD